MANIFNIFAGVFAFLCATSLVYGLWGPVMDWLDYFPLELYIICGVMWLLMCFASIVYYPFIMLVSDDRGG